MRIIALTNIKGGVGKTTAAVNLAYLAAAGGRRTLLWDLDPQGGATWTLRGEPAESVSAKKLVSGQRELPEVVAATAYENLDLLAADFSYRKFDLHLSERKRPTERLLKMSRSLRDRYEFLFLDCPPGISLLSENVLRAADAVVIPLVPAPLSVRMLTELAAFVAREGWDDLALLPFFSMVDRRKSLHEAVIASTRARSPGVLATEVPYSSEIERMSERRAPLPAYAPRSPAAQVYAALFEEILQRIGESTAPGLAPAVLPAAPPARAAVAAVEASVRRAPAPAPATVAGPAPLPPTSPPGWPSRPEASEWRIRPGPEPIKDR